MKYVGKNCRWKRRRIHERATIELTELVGAFSNLKRDLNRGLYLLDSFSTQVVLPELPKAAAAMEESLIPPAAYLPASRAQGAEPCTGQYHLAKSTADKHTAVHLLQLQLERQHGRDTGDDRMVFNISSSQ